MSKQKEKELTVWAVKNMIYRQVIKKEKHVDPPKYNMQLLEDNLIEVKAMQFILMIINYYRLRETSQPTMG